MTKATSNKNNLKSHALVGNHAFLSDRFHRHTPPKLRKRVPSTSRFTNGDKRIHQSNLSPYLHHTPNARSATTRTNSLSRSDSEEVGTVFTPSTPAAPPPQSSASQPPLRCESSHPPSC